MMMRLVPSVEQHEQQARNMLGLLAEKIKGELRDGAPNYHRLCGIIEQTCELVKAELKEAEELAAA